MTAFAASPSLAPANPARAEVIDFARRMTEHGSVTVTSPMHADLVEHRLAVHDTDTDGYGVIFLSVTDGQPEVTTIDFDFGDTARRHLMHPDGQALTLCDIHHRPLVTYRIG